MSFFFRVPFGHSHMETQHLGSHPFDLWPAVNATFSLCFIVSNPTCSRKFIPDVTWPPRIICDSLSPSPSQSRAAFLTELSISFNHTHLV